eukprot:1780891-Amphidinium_carterae.3
MHPTRPRNAPLMTNRLWQAKVEDIFDLMNLDDAPRDKLLEGMEVAQKHDVAKVGIQCQSAREKVGWGICMRARTKGSHIGMRGVQPLSMHIA